MHPTKSEVLGACAGAMEASRKAFKEESNWKTTICRYSGKDQTCFDMENKGYCRYIHPDVDGEAPGGENDNGWEDDEDDVPPQEDENADPPKGKGSGSSGINAKRGPKPPEKGKGKTMLSGKKRTHDESSDSLPALVSKMRHMSSAELSIVNDESRKELDRRNEGTSTASKWKLWSKDG